MQFAPFYFLTKFDRGILDQSERLLFPPFAHAKDGGRCQAIGDIGTGHLKLAAENVRSAAIIADTLESRIPDGYADDSGAKRERPAVGYDHAEAFEFESLS